MSSQKTTRLLGAMLIGLVVGGAIGYVLAGTAYAGWYSPEQYAAAVGAREATSVLALQKLTGGVQYSRLGFDSWDKIPVKSTLTGTIQIGGLFVMTGVLATFGENEYEAAKLAEKHVNELLETAGYQWKIQVVPEDTALGAGGDPLEKLKSLAARGIKLVMGPLASSEVRAIKGYADQEKILVISQSSTAPDLALAGDYIYRFCPSDKGGQGPAMGRILYDDGIRYVIPATRNDAWGTGLEAAAKKRFEELGGAFLDGVLYAETATEFSLETADLATKVTDAISKYGADKVGVLHISFEEANAFFTAAAKYNVLDDVRWYGSDGVAQSGDMTGDPVVADFAVRVGYPCTIFAPAVSDKYAMVKQNGLDVLGREPDSYSFAIYDIVWAYALSILKADSKDPATVRDVMSSVLVSYYGASGRIDLDQYGDRKAADYFIWKIEKTTGYPGYTWKLAGTYVLASDSVEWE